MTEQPETTEDQRPAEAPEQHQERPGYGVTRKFPVPADETPATTDDDQDSEDDE